MSFMALSVPLLWATLAHAGDIEAQAERLATLRAEVEALSSEVELEKEDLRGRLRALEAQQVDLEVQIRREELRLERLLAEEEKQRQVLESAASRDDLSPAVRAGITQLRAVVSAGLPFKASERLGALAELEQKLSDGSLSAEQAATRLWAFAEDERRLTRENALDRQVIPLEGEEVLVDVARVGMVALYFHTPSGAYGQARREGDGWRWVLLTSEADAAQAEALFDALARGIRVGWFSLPQPLSLTGGAL